MVTIQYLLLILSRQNIKSRTRRDRLTQNDIGTINISSPTFAETVPSLVTQVRVYFLLLPHLACFSCMSTDTDGPFSLGRLLFVHREKQLLHFSHIVSKTLRSRRSYKWEEIIYDSLAYNGEYENANMGRMHLS